MTQNEALRILKTGANALVTGEPGSGKTHTINAYVSWLRSHGIEPAITASTGIAATHVGGMTIHSWSGIGIREHLTASDLDAISNKEYLARRIGKTSVLIIDEVSMLSGNVLTMVDKVLREIKQTDRAFGGVQVILVGDFFQLPPIAKGSQDASFAFESDAFRALNPLIIYLSEQHRQDDPAFCSILANIRSGACDQSDISKILARETDAEGLEDDIPRLFTHNADVDRINGERLAAIPGSAKRFRMDESGSEVLVEALKRGCLSPQTLELKEGAVVMFTKNNPLGGYANGTLGTVSGFSSFGSPIVETRDGRTIHVEPMEWVVEENGKIRAKVVQVPLRLAWAITIHKSQGQSLDAAAIDLSRAFEYGQGYVALSRLRQLSGLSLLGWNEHALAIHPTVTAKDAEFKKAALEAAEAFAELEQTGERAQLEKNFILASGGTLEAVAEGERPEKLSTYDQTLVLIEAGKGLDDIATERKLTSGTIAGHVAQLHENGRITREQVEALLPKRIIEALPKIREAFEKWGSERLTPVYLRLKKSFTYDELKLARALLTDDEEDQIF